MALVYNAAGVAGLKLWKFACTATALLFVADTEASTGAPPTIQLVILFAAACGFCCRRNCGRRCSASFCWARCSPCWRATTIAARARLWLAVPLMALWANLHGGFFIGIATLALYSAVAALRDLVAGAGWRRGAQTVPADRRRGRGHAAQSVRPRDVGDGGARASQSLHAQRGQRLAAALVGDAERSGIPRLRASCSTLAVIAMVGRTGDRIGGGAARGRSAAGRGRGDDVARGYSSPCAIWRSPRWR